MKTSMAFKAIKNTVFSVMVLAPLQLNMEVLPKETFALGGVETNYQQEETPPSASPKVVLLDLENTYCNTECYLNEVSDTIEFFADAFQIKSSYIIEDLKNKNDKMTFDKFNIGVLRNKNGELKTFGSFEEGLIEYLFEFAKQNPKLVSNKINPCKKNADYIVDLIKYYTSIYDNVDYLTAVSIGAAESGYYKVKYMLNCNNIYGGMGNNGLIKHKNIEYGVLQYIRMLSKNYYAKGLDTVEKIGRIYCPVRTESGAKVASSHWIKLVNNAKNKYKDTFEDITVERLIND